MIAMITQQVNSVHITELLLYPLIINMPYTNELLVILLDFTVRGVSRRGVSI